MTIRGATGEGADSPRRNLVTIGCQYKDGGIAFFNVSDLVVSDITVMQCGVYAATVASEIYKLDNDTSRVYFESWLHYPYYVAMYILQSFDTRLERVLISDSFQSGLICIDCLGNTSISQSVITRSNYHLTDLPNVTSLCSRDSYLCCGRNIWVEFTIPGALSTRIHHYFTVEETVISYGTDLSVNRNLTCGGGMVVEAVFPPLYRRYFLHISILSSSFERNLGRHLSVAVTAGHLVNISVKDCTFLAANGMSIVNLVPFTSTPDGTVRFYLIRSFFSIPSALALADNGSNTVNIALTNISCTENFGGGIAVIKDHLNKFDGQLHLTVRNSQVTRNYLLYDLCTFMSPAIALVGLTQTSGLTAVLEGVQISHNYVAFSSEVDQEGVCEYDRMYSLLTVNADIHLNSTTFLNNTVSALGAFGSEVHFHKHNIFRHNVGVCGGALSLNTGSVMILYKGTLILIVKKFGGGICMDDGNWPLSFVSEHNCYYQVRMSNEYNEFPKIILEHNTAAITGYSVYGYLMPCLETIYTYYQPSRIHDRDFVAFQIFRSIFQFQFPPGTENYQVSTKPVGLCFCPEVIECERRIEFLSAYPGQRIQLRAVGIGTTGFSWGISPAVVHSRIHPTHFSGGNLAVVPEVLSLWNICEYLNYTVFAPEGIAGVIVTLSVEGYPSRFILEVELNTLLCPNGFIFSHNTMSCVCTTILEQVSVQCRINTQTFVRSGSVWIGVRSEELILLTHSHCPNSYCRSQEVEFSLANLDAQCALNHSGVLCGGCQEGLALLLGSPKCQKCSDGYIALVTVFAAVGVVLVLSLGKLDLTVAIGAINGFLFYANAIKASSDALTNSPYLSMYFLMPLSWLNLDLGIEVCFSSRLDMFWKAMLQFVFPVYIWLLVAGIIFASRYSPLAARLSGSNSVPVLATLFLLSYAKVLDTVIATFSFTFMTTERGRPLV